MQPMGQSVHYAFHLPVWDPSVAAAAGAGFAGVLGALLLAATFQIAIMKRGKQRLGLNSLSAAPIALFLLLAAAYLYVVLSGTTAISSATVTVNNETIKLVDFCQT